jgi:hypothetical protein
MEFFKKTKFNKIKFNSFLSLDQIANSLEMDKGTIDKDSLSWGKDWPYHNCLGYTKTYEIYMTSYRKSKVKLLEIGVYDKRFPMASIKMWLQYFKNVDLYGMDNFWGGSYLEDKISDIELINSWGANFIYADQGSFCDWDEIIECCPKDFDFIIDDGSHWSNHMMVSLWKASNILKSGGYYFMEDIQNPRRTRGEYRYDNSIVGEDLLEALHTGYIDSRVLNDQQNYDINKDFELIELVLSDPKTLYLAVFQKK